PPLGGEFRHVGRSIQCPTDGFFDAQTGILGRDGDEPGFMASAFAGGVADAVALISLKLLRPVGPGLVGRVSALLPRMVRDHIPQNYFRALSVKVGPGT